MSTKLICGAKGCGRQCGMAERRARGKSLDRRYLLIDQRYDNQRHRGDWDHLPAGWRDSRRDTPAIVCALDPADDWPVHLECEHCHADLVLDLDSALLVDQESHIYLQLAGAR